LESEKSIGGMFPAKASLSKEFSSLSKLRNNITISPFFTSYAIKEKEYMSRYILYRKILSGIKILETKIVVLVI
jgi:hypothetical protein